MRTKRLIQSLTLDRLVTAIVFIAIFTMAVRVPIDTDSWWHLQAGRWSVENGSILQTDFFSHTRYGTEWINHSWLAQIILYLTFDVLGYPGLAILVAILVTAAFALLWQQCREANRWVRAFIMILAAATSGVIWAARPQMISFALTAAVATLLHRFRQGDTKALWWLPPIVLIWVNMHGGFAVAFILMVAVAFGEIGNLILGMDNVGWQGLKQLLIVFAVCLLVVPLNPNGIQMWGYPFRTVGIGVLQDFIAEWRPPDFHQLHLHPFIWMVLGTLTVLGLAGQRASFSDLTLVALFAYMSLLAGRNIALFALLAAPVMIKYGDLALARLRQQTSDPRAGPRFVHRPGTISDRPALQALNWALLSLVVLAALIKISQPLGLQVIQKAITGMVPVDAVAHIAETQPDGPLLNSYNWGGYLIWELTDYPVFVDGRTDLYDDAFLRDYLSILFANDGWQQKLADYDINLILIESNSMLGRILPAESSWRQTYRDEMATVLVRQ